MTVGMPGTGIGGLFYVAGALCMPLREAVGAIWRRARPRQLGLALRQGAIAVGGVAGIWAAGWLAGVLLRASVARHAGAGGASAETLSHAIPQWGALAITVATLVALLVAVQLLRLVLGRASAGPTDWHAL
ncbi:MAG: hypothetical protein ACREMV_11820, partial [Gemmatimonadales bacterium]